MVKADAVIAIIHMVIIFIARTNIIFAIDYMSLKGCSLSLLSLLSMFADFSYLFVTVQVECGKIDILCTKTTIFLVYQLNVALSSIVYDLLVP